MSDGPYRSLAMRPAWKKTAKFAEKAAYEVDDISDAVTSASISDWRNDVSGMLLRGVSEVLASSDGLFSAPDQKVMQLEALRRATAGHTLGQLLLDCAIERALSSASGEDALIDAASAAISTWWARISRQIDEHYCREASGRLTRDVRSRLNAAIGDLSAEALARQLLSSSKAPANRKKTELDDGVRL